MCPALPILQCLILTRIPSAISDSNCETGSLFFGFCSVTRGGTAGSPRHHQEQSPHAPHDAAARQRCTWLVGTQADLNSERIHACLALPLLLARCFGCQEPRARIPRSTGKA